MNVCMIVPDLDRIGGYEKQAWGLSVFCRNHGVEVGILTTRGQGGVERECRQGIPVHRFLPRQTKGFFSDLRIGYALCRFLLGEGRKARIVHAHVVTRTTLLGLFIARLFGRKSIIKIATEGDISSIAAGSRLGKTLLIFFLSCAARIVCLSSSISREMTALGISEDKLFLSSNGVDISAFFPADAVVRKQKKQLLEIDAETVVLFVGRFEHRKGVDLLVEAWPAVVGQCPGACLVLVGDGAEYAAMARMVARGEHSAGILFRGSQNNVRDYMQAADVFVVPSRREGNPNVLLEACACGLAIAATDIGGIADVVAEGKDALLVPANESARLGQAIVKIIEDRQLRARLGERARRKAVEEFSFDVVGNRYLEQYRILMR
ncbi:MAG: glycosyltransferase family 4 protein [Candidatus Omnitrophica bacterium]|nr:glycosyltransferase family 4 protein [Candidatus Omnitrophota bacterium]